jgi:hypothetical protein
MGQKRRLLQWRTARLDFRYAPPASEIARRRNKSRRASSEHLVYDRSGNNVAARGKITRISPNSPGFVSISIEPPCCLTMMSRD